MLQHAPPARPSPRSTPAQAGRGAQPSPEAPARAGAVSGWAFRATAGATLPLSRPGDRDEVEADRLAERVLAPGGAALPLAISRAGSTPRMRRCAKCAAAGVPCTCGEEEQVRRKEASFAGGEQAVDAAPVRAVTGRSGTPLDAPTRAFFEMRFGRDLGGVRVHADAAAADSARSVSALAYTVGSSVVFGAGQYAPETASGRRLLAHELAHVVQQQDGAVPALRRQTPPAAAPSQPREYGVVPPPGAPLEEVKAYQLERDELECRFDARTQPPRCTFSAKRQGIVSELKSAALESASRAEARVHAGGAGVAAAAARIFNLTTPPDLPAMADTIERIAATLRIKPIVCATCGDKLCQQERGDSPVPAVVPNTLEHIIICPAFFSPEATYIYRRRTLLHEAGHALGIDDAVEYTHPPYCSKEDHACANPCPDGSDLRNVDAWAWFIQCVDSALTTQPGACTFTDRQRQQVTTSHFDALSLCSRASQASSSGDRRIAALASGIFHVQNPDMKAVADRVVAIHDALSVAPALCGAADDPACAGGAPVYVPEDLKSLVICPAFFPAGIGERRRALLREAAHLARVGPAQPSAARDTCNPADCSDPCPTVRGYGSPDAWARYIECAAFRA